MFPEPELPDRDGVEPPLAGLVHLYRGELARSDRWRTRLDTTTNWALTTTAAVISLGFANAGVPHGALLMGIVMVVAFLVIEARRYRYYDLWIRRVRLLENGFWAPLLRREPADPDALKELARDLAHPRLQITLLRALAVRVRHNYGPILLVLIAAWYVKVHMTPTPATSFGEFLHRAHFGGIPGAIVAAVVAVFTLFWIALFVSALVVRAPPGELRPRAGTSFPRQLLPRRRVRIEPPAGRRDAELPFPR